jgi:hypothetical protein
LIPIGEKDNQASDQKSDAYRVANVVYVNQVVFRLKDKRNLGLENIF